MCEADLKTNVEITIEPAQVPAVTFGAGSFIG